MTGVSLGSAPITGVYVGGSLARGLYIGSTKIWPAAAAAVAMLQAVAGKSQSLGGTANAKPYSAVVGLESAPGEAVTAKIGSTTLPKIADNGDPNFTIGACGAGTGASGAITYQGSMSSFPLVGLQLSGVSGVTMQTAASPASQAVTCPPGGYVVQIIAYQAGAKITATAGTGQTVLADFYDSGTRIGFHVRGAAQSTTFASSISGSQGTAIALVFS